MGPGVRGMRGYGNHLKITGAEECAWKVRRMLSTGSDLRTVRPERTNSLILLLDFSAAHIYCADPGISPV